MLYYCHYGTTIGSHFRRLLHTVGLPCPEQIQKLMGLSGSCYPLHKLLPHSHRLVESTLGHWCDSLPSGQIPHAHEAVHMVARAPESKTGLPRVWKVLHHGLL